MNRSTIALALASSIVASTAAANDLIIDVNVGEKGFVLRGNEIVREVGPGTHYRLPFIERWALINALYEREALFETTSKLADGSDCTVSGRLIFRITDARRALEWRLENDPDIPAKGSIPVSTSAYKLVEQTLRTRLEKIMSGTSPEDATTGAIEAAFATQALRPQDLDDGTSTIRSTVRSVSCSDWKPPARASQTNCPAIFGTPQPYERQTIWTTPAPEFGTFTVETKEFIVLLTDRKRAKMVAPVVTFAIADPARHERAFGSNTERASRLASHSIQNAIGMVIGRMKSDDVPSFFNNFFETKFPQKVHAQLLEYGLRVISADFSQATYRFTMPDPDCKPDK